MRHEVWGNRKQTTTDLVEYDTSRKENLFWKRSPSAAEAASPLKGRICCVFSSISLNTRGLTPL